MRLVAGDGRTRAWYVLGTWRYRFAGGSQFRFFEFSARVRDEIPDDLRQWFQPLGEPGRMMDRIDFLPGRNAWKNSLYLDLDQRLGKQIRLLHRFKWDWVEQQDPADEVQFREGRKTSGFLGAINKVEWSIPVGLGVLEPRFKSEFRRERPFQHAPLGIHELGGNLLPDMDAAAFGRGGGYQLLPPLRSPDLQY